MSQLKEILEMEKERGSLEQCAVIHLFREGTFYRAYEWSAWLCVRYFTELKVTHGLYESVPTATTGRLRTTIATTRTSWTSTIRTSARTTAATDTTVRVCVSCALPNNSLLPREGVLQLWGWGALPQAAGRSLVRRLFLRLLCHSRRGQWGGGNL